MKAILKLNENVSIEVESENIVDLVSQMTDVRESIGPEPCGKCKKNNTMPQTRTIGDDTFYEIKCADCGAVLQLGMSKGDGKLYKKRMKTDGKGKAVKDDNGKAVYLSNNGWLKWNPEKKEME